ncbi:S-layer homology domain-containing protein [Oscillibacter sp. GMB15532]|uniref:S-layer homology domain-containing protein n=1 Tax=Oscillibacter sp. GMB15532 TaxID=3230022 RepID=UPI0034DEE8F9
MKKIFQGLVCAVLCLSVTLVVPVFGYAKAPAWCADAVNYCDENHLFHGVPQAEKSLDNIVTWGVFSQILSNSTSNYDGTYYQPGLVMDSNAKDREIYRAAMNWTKSFWIVDDLKQETDPMTRAETANALYAYFGRTDVKVAQPKLSSRFTDFNDIPDDLRSGVLFAEANSLINGFGDSTFGPNRPITVAELSQILYNGKNLFQNAAMEKLFVLSASNVDSIEFRNGYNFEQHITNNKNVIKDVIDHLNAFRFKNMESADYDGWSYGFKIYFKDGKEFNFMLDPNWVRVCGVGYAPAKEFFPKSWLDQYCLPYDI